MLHAQEFLRGEAGRYWVALSLREAESLRAAMHVALDSGRPLVAPAAGAAGVGVALRLIDPLGQDLRIEAVGPLASGAAAAAAKAAKAGGGQGGGVGGVVDYRGIYPEPPRLQLGSAVQAYRFMDSQLAYLEPHVRLLLRMLRPDATDARRRWFTDVHGCRRRPPLRADRVRAGGLESLFGVPDEFGIVLRHAMQWRLGREMAARELGTHEVHAAFNARQDGLLTCAELSAGLEWLGMAAANEAEVHALMRALDADADGVCSVEEWSEAFPGIAESVASTQQALAALSLQPHAHIRELAQVTVDDGGRSELAAKSVPREALAKFKFKLQPTKGFVPVWSNKGGGGAPREQLSLWAPELDHASFDLKQLKKGKNASVRICFGHYATAAHEPPPAKHVKVLEVTDTDVGPLGSSEHLASVIEQLLPTPQVIAPHPLLLFPRVRRPAVHCARARFSLQLFSHTATHTRTPRTRTPHTRAHAHTHTYTIHHAHANALLTPAHSRERRRHCRSATVSSGTSASRATPRRSICGGRCRRRRSSSRWEWSRPPRRSRRRSTPSDACRAAGAAPRPSSRSGSTRSRCRAAARAAYGRRAGRSPSWWRRRPPPMRRRRRRSRSRSRRSDGLANPSRSQTW